MVGAQSIIADIVPPRERGAYMGLIGSVFAVASVAGPLLGGFLVESLDWRWVFYVNMPIGAVAVLVVIFRLHLRTPAQRHTIDWLGAAAPDRGRERDHPPHHLGRRTSTPGARRPSSASPPRASPCSPPSSGRSAARPSRSSRCRCSARASSGSASAIGFVIGLAMFGAIVFIPLFLQLVYGVSPTSSGLRMLPLMAGLLTASIASGRVITRLGRYKAFPIAGTAVDDARPVPAVAARGRDAALARLGLHARGGRSASGS